MDGTGMMAHVHSQKFPFSHMREKERFPHHQKLEPTIGKHHDP
jgi:hypothetical protein